MNRSKIIAVAVACAAGLAAAGTTVVAQDAHKPDSQHAQGAHKDGKGHDNAEHRRKMQSMAEKHERMGEMHRGMEHRGKSGGKQDSKKPESEEHKH